MPVFVEKPKSFEVEDFLAAFAAANGNFFFMINPVNPEDGRGPAIDNTWLNVPVIGLSTHDRSKDSPLGYTIPGQKPEERDDTEYIPEALLIFELSPESLPQELEGITWVIQVKKYEQMDLFRPIAEALGKEFSVNIVMTPSQMNDIDPKHLKARPVRKDFPDGPQFQPILIRTIEKK